MDTAATVNAYRNGVLYHYTNLFIFDQMEREIEDSGNSLCL